MPLKLRTKLRQVAEKLSKTCGKLAENSRKLAENSRKLAENSRKLAENLWKTTSMFPACVINDPSIPLHSFLPPIPLILGLIFAIFKLFPSPRLFFHRFLSHFLVCSRLASPCGKIKPLFPSAHTPRGLLSKIF